MSIERPPIPTEERKPAWRLACLAYRAKRREGAQRSGSTWRGRELAAVVSLPSDRLSLLKMAKDYDRRRRLRKRDRESKKRPNLPPVVLGATAQPLSPLRVARFRVPDRGSV